MVASILQLQATAAQDVYLTQNPEINIFKYSYYRYVNFATETLKLELNESLTFNKKVTCNIPKKGHLLSKLYIHIKLPELTPSSGTYLCWTDALGYSIFQDAIELEIGGVVVDKFYPQFADMWDEFTNSDNMYGKNLMLLKSDVYSCVKYNANKTANLMIPLDFWFTKQYSSSLPLLSMDYQDIRISFKLKEFNKLVLYDGTQPNTVSILQANVIAEYIYLDDIIIDQFKKQTHMYIIDQIQYNEPELIDVNISNYNSLLKFNNPVKEILFSCAEKSIVESNNHFTYGSSTNDPLVQEISLLLEGKQRYEFLPEVYFRTITPNNVHSVIPLKYIYCIPFSLRPEDSQPTGSINMSRFNDVVLSLKFPPGSQAIYLYTYALSYNIIKIEKGILSFEFVI